MMSQSIPGKSGQPMHADPEFAARKLIELANSVEAVQDSRIHIELLNGPFDLKGTTAEYHRRSPLGDRTRLAGHARERHLREVHPGWSRFVA
jgi:hypothetical protein